MPNSFAKMTSGQRLFRRVRIEIGTGSSKIVILKGLKGSARGIGALSAQLETC